jgi:MFS family permease
MSSQAEPAAAHRARWGPICGVLFVVVLAVSFFITSTPNTNKSPQDILNYYIKQSHKTALGISTILADIAVVFAIFWFGYLRDRFGRSDVGSRLAPVLLAGAIILASGGLVFSGAQLALIDQPKHMLPATAQTLNFLQSDIGAAGIVVGVSIIMWAAGFIILRTRILPVWLAWVSFVLGLAGLAGPVGFVAFLATGLWILIVAFYMWRFESTLPVSGEVVERPSADVSSGAPE